MMTDLRELNKDTPAAGKNESWSRQAMTLRRRIVEWNVKPTRQRSAE